MKNRAFVVIFFNGLGTTSDSVSAHTAGCCMRETFCVNSVLCWWFFNTGQWPDWAVLKLTCLKVHKWMWRTSFSIALCTLPHAVISTYAKNI